MEEYLRFRPKDLSWLEGKSKDRDGIGDDDSIKLGPELFPWLGFDHDKTETHPVSTLDVYPTLRGWSIQEIQELQSGKLPQRRSSQDVLALFQSWLLFGYLEALLDMNVESEHFVVSVKGEQAFHKAHLFPYYDFRMLAIAAMSDEDRVKEYQRITALRVKASQLFQALVDTGTQFETPDSRIDIVLVQHQLLRSTDIYLVIRLDAVSKGHKSVWEYYKRVIIPMPESILEELRLAARKQGWCPAIVAQVQRIGVDVLYFAANMMTDIPVSSAEPDQPNASQHVDQHVACTEFQCSAYNIPDDVVLMPPHISTACCTNRSFITVPIEDLYRCIRNGIIPLVTAAIPARYDDIELKITPYEPGMKYAAYSHVWSDGLGSTAERGLPRCQVWYMLGHCYHALYLNLGQKYCTLFAKSFSKEAHGQVVHFWIDSLCVPQRNDGCASGELSLRKQAIRQMSGIYEHASATVIIDSDLSNILSIQSAEERLLRLLTSKWMHRVWTLPESAISQDARLLLSGGREMAKLKSFVDIPPNMLTPINWKLAGALKSILRPDNGREKLERVLEQLQWRTMQRPTEVTVAIAPLVDVPIEPLLRASDEEARMEQFWLSLPAIPRWVIFYSGEKMCKPGFRWANKRFLPASSRNFSFDKADPIKDCEASCTSRGLRAMYFICKAEHSELRIDDIQHPHELAIHDQHRSTTIMPFDIELDTFEGLEYDIILSLVAFSDMEGLADTAIALASIDYENCSEDLIAVKYKARARGERFNESTEHTKARKGHGIYSEVLIS